MSEGSITLTNNSTTVSGNGTSFTSQLKPGDFIYVMVGGSPYTMIAAAVGSNTQLTLSVAYDGPTASGLAWSAVPFLMSVAITQKILNDFGAVGRAQMLQMQNWQAIYSDAASVTVTRPDRSTFTGPSWGYMANQYANKADKSALGNSASRNVGTTSGTVAAGDDSRITGALQKSGGTVTGAFRAVVASFSLAGGTGDKNDIVGVTGDGNTGSTGYVGAWQYKWYNDIWYAGITRGSGGDTRSYSIFYNGSSTGTSRLWAFNVDGSLSGAGAYINGSDERHKSEITLVENPLSAVLSWRGAKFDVKDGVRTAGLIAQDVEKWCPEAIKTYGDRTFSDGEVIKDFKYLDISGASAAYHNEAIRSLFSLVELALTDPDKALAFIDKIKADVITPESGS
ncbi:tail fiber domain-containing protein [Pantoea ananatis]|uniref:tail fiber domain-containing protein n=1 Tax=Pantoea ananas TaxID=553 RepID=UPI001FF607C2|nr:tail fiber domain-containing protein [Pantoea ananatis]MCK0554301.1 tail fiber domain-containing protein [Pantoea ananatis]